jgi:hypothetical protein
MAQEDGLVGGARRLGQRVKDAIMSIPTPQRKQDTSWHDSMVRKANESFRKAAVKPAAKTRPAKRKTAPTRKEKASGR